MNIHGGFLLVNCNCKGRTGGEIGHVLGMEIMGDRPN